MLDFSFKLIPAKCCLCGKSLFGKSIDICDVCIGLLPYYDNKSTLSRVHLFEYDYPVNHMILEIKFYNKLHYSLLLSTLLSYKIKQLYSDSIEQMPEVIIPVPLHTKRLKERGFNQSVEIAKVLSRNLNIKIDNKSCIRTKYTLPQLTLSGSQRVNNVKNAFVVRNKINYKHIVLVDDVFTTGSTIKELSKAIISSYDDIIIDVWTLAKAST